MSGHRRSRMDAGAISFQQIVHWPGHRVLAQRRPPGEKPKRGALPKRFAATGNTPQADESPGSPGFDDSECTEPLGTLEEADDIPVGATELRRQLQWLKAQKRGEVVRLKKISRSASDSQIRARQAQTTAQRHAFAMGQHQLTLDEATDSLQRLKAPRAVSEALASPTGGSPPGGIPQGCGAGTSQDLNAGAVSRSSDGDDGFGHYGQYGHATSADSFAEPSSPPDASPSGHGSAPTVGIGCARPGKQGLLRSSSGLSAAGISNASNDFNAAIDCLDSIRKAVREELKYKAGGSALAAFRVMNSTGTGRVSLHDFGASLDRLQVDWRRLTGLRHERHLFRIFDKNRDGHLDFAELFPDEPPVIETARPDKTLEFMMQYRQAGGRHSDGMPRCARWQLGGMEEEYRAQCEAEAMRDFRAELRAETRLTLRRLRRCGRADEQLKEVVATRMPKLPQSPTPTSGDPERRLQKQIGELKEQRRLLQTTRQQLYSSCFEVDDKQRAEKEAMPFAIAFAGFGSSLMSKIRDSRPPDEAFAS